MRGKPRSRTLALFRRALGGNAQDVASARSGDPDRLDRVRQLLRAHHEVQQSSFLAIDEPSDDEARADRVQLASMCGRRIGPYTVIDVLEAGGMGLVYRAEQQRPRRPVALKVIRPHLASPQMLRNFGCEAAALGRLRHPCIARILEAGTADVDGRRLHFIAMDIIEGRTLMAYAGLCSARRRLHLFGRICDAVHYAHEQGVIHCDLKPENILVERTPIGAVPVVLDFGIACVTRGEGDTVCPHVGTGQMLGTLRYMSPEQCEGDTARLDARTDVYALGVMLLELATEADTAGRDLPGDLESIIAKALEPDRERRYASVSGLVADVRRFLHAPLIETTRAARRRRSAGVTRADLHPS